MSVTAKLFALQLSLISLTISSLVEIINHVLGAVQRILVSILAETKELSLGNSSPSIFKFFCSIFAF